MQTPAERALINHVAEKITKKQPTNEPVRIINIGAGKSIVIENYLKERDLHFISDRVDVEDCRASAPFIGQNYQTSIISMPEVSSNGYEVAFANYVLEHVSDIDKAAEELYRILKPNGSFVVSTPNPRAPEFFLSHITPLSFHQWVRGSQSEHRAFETIYAYKTITQLVEIFEKAGFKLQHADYFPATLTYLYRFPLLRSLSRFYDTIIKAMNIKSLLGNVCLVFVKA